MLTVWGRLSAYNFQKVHWFLEELGIEYQHVNVGGAIGGLNTEEFLNMNPNGRIPVIRDGANIIWESNSILRYLSAVYSPEEYWDDSPANRSTFERWMDWELSALQPAFIDLFWGYYRTPVDERDERKIEHNRHRCEQYINILNSHLEKNEYVSGDKFGLGDICVGACFYRYFNMGLEVTKPERVSEWYTKLVNRPCYKKVMQVPFSELKGRLEF